MNITLIKWLAALVTLGAGVWLCGFGCASKPQSAPIPRASGLLKDALTVTTNRWFFAATATDRNSLTSDYSGEVSLLDTNGTTRTVSLAWDAPVCTNVITNYTIWQGAASRIYTNSVNVGTNLTGTVRVLPPLPPPPTNLVTTITGMAASSPQGPWLAVPSWPSISITNPTGNAFYRVAVTTTNQ